MLNEYAIYKGDEFIDVGTANELAAQLKIKVNTIYAYMTPSRQERAKTSGNMMYAVRLEDEDE